MTEVSTIGLDLAKNVFQAHGASSAGAVIFRRKLRRDQVLAFFAAQPPCLVAMEACPGVHYWGREIGKLGHTVRLIAPAYVKPFVKRQKNDMSDAEAICEAAQRPTMRFVAVKSEAKQASAVIFRTRDILVGQRTQLINAIRGHLSEYGLIAPQGPFHIGRLIAQIEDPTSSVPSLLPCPPRRGVAPSAEPNRRAGYGDLCPRQSRRRDSASDERAWDRPPDRHRHRGARAASGDVPIGP